MIDLDLYGSDWSQAKEYIIYKIIRSDFLRVIYFIQNNFLI